MPISHFDVVVIVSDVILEPFFLLLTLEKSFRNTNKTNSLHITRYPSNPNVHFKCLFNFIVPKDFLN